MSKFMFPALVFALFGHLSMAVAQKDISDFPIITYRAEKEKPVEIFYISGDGGMNEFSKSFCTKLSEQGYSVIALDAKKYFWGKKSPQIFAEDLSVIIRHFQESWNKDSFVLLGYSFGADVGAFIPGRLSTDLVKKMVFSVFLNPSLTTDFEVKLMDMLGKNPENRKYDVSSELNSLRHLPVMCLVSEDESEKLSGQIHNDEITIRVLPGDHRFNHDVDLIISTIVGLI